MADWSQLREKGAITGIGETEYVRSSKRSLVSLQMESCLEAIADAGLVPSDIDGIIAKAGSGLTAEDVITNLGLEDLKFSGTTPLGGASGNAAIQCATAVIAAGICHHVLIPIARKRARIAEHISSIPQFSQLAEFEMPLGINSPAQYYAPMARRHMELYGTTSRQFAEVAMTMRRHAALHGNAVMKEPMTLEQHQTSRMITDPFRLLDCSLENDGGVAIVVSAADRACDMRSRPVYVCGVAEGHPDSPGAISQRREITRLGIAKAAPRAFQMAGITHAEIDVAQIYDCFTYMVICQLEDLGFCAKGEGGEFVADGNIALGSRLPVNTHGGLLSQSHMAGMAHIVELVRQLRGEAGAAQVPGAEWGLTTGYGDLGDGSIAIMTGGRP